MSTSITTEAPRTRAKALKVTPVAKRPSAKKGGAREAVAPAVMPPLQASALQPAERVSELETIIGKFGPASDVASLVSGLRQIRALEDADPDNSDENVQLYDGPREILEEKLMGATPRTLEDAALKLEFLVGEASAFDFSECKPGFVSVIEALRAGTLATAQQNQPPTADGADAEIIRIAAEHAANRAAVNTCDDQALVESVHWPAYERTREALHAAQPQTLTGMLAKARAAKAEALNTITGKEEPDHGPAASWAWDLVNDLLRLNPCSVVVAPPIQEAAEARLPDQLNPIERTVFQVLFDKEIATADPKEPVAAVAMRAMANLDRHGADLRAPAPASPAKKSSRAKSNPEKKMWPAHPFDALPFIDPGKPGECRNFWAPRPTGDYSFDCGLGEIYAEAALPHLTEPGSMLLRQIVFAMIDHGDLDRDKGVIVGMMSAIERRLCAA